MVRNLCAPERATGEDAVTESAGPIPVNRKTQALPCCRLYSTELYKVRCVSQCRKYKDAGPERHSNSHNGCVVE